MKIVLTGADGFLGTWLSKAFKAKGFEVFALTADIRSFGEVYSSLFKAGDFDFVIHLAGVSSPDVAEANPEKAFSVNTMGTQILLTALAKLGSKAAFIFAGTGQVYQIDPNAEVELTEVSKVGPSNIYALSKWHAELVIKDMVERGVISQGLIIRMFNHTHYTQSPQFFLPRIYEQLKKSEATKVKIKVGGIDSMRDVGAISDLVDAYLAVITKANLLPKFDTFNLSSGVRRNLRNIGLELGRQLGKKIDFEIDSSRVRQNEPKSICGSNLKLRSATGWSPKVVSDEDLIASFLKKEV